MGKLTSILEDFDYSNINEIDIQYKGREYGHVKFKTELHLGGTLTLLERKLAEAIGKAICFSSFMGIWEQGKIEKLVVRLLLKGLDKSKSIKELSELYQVPGYVIEDYLKEKD